jgi:hypothetical protein
VVVTEDWGEILKYEQEKFEEEKKKEKEDINRKKRLIRDTLHRQI